MILNLVLNNNNVVSGSNNTRYKYKFNAPLEILDEAEMTIANITLPYSWFNISKINQNNSFSIAYPIPSGSAIINGILPDGYYTVDDINAYCQSLMIAAGFYLIDENGNNVFYLSLLYNPTYYAVQVVAISVPLSLPANWTAPSTWTGFPPSGTFSVTFTPNTGLGKILGFVGGSAVGNWVTSYSVLSTLVPQGSVVNSLVIRSNIINNDSGFPTDVLDTMPITSAFGTNINYSPPTLKWIKCTAGTFQSFEVFFCDQNLNPMYILDSNVCISILLKNKGNKILPYINAEEGRNQKLVQLERLKINLEE